MRIAGVKPLSLVNGEGCRFVVFLQGCDHRCPGCHNPETWDFEGGLEVDPEWIAYDYLKHAHLLDGITLSGGDPFYQEAECMDLIDLLDDGTNVWVYTGYEYDEVKDTELGRRADVLVTGPFVRELKCEGKMYGSSNQEIHRRGGTDG